jgi:stearoyl-CoA desaturase (delta-9 desaturase)
MSNNTAKPPLNPVNTIIFVGLPLAALILVPAWGIYRGYDGFQWLWALAFLYLNGMSITGGYHRLWAHRAYRASTGLKWFFAFWGAGALQNSILIWASDHRRHHRHVDDNELDPYSAGRGLWFSHMGWMLRQYRSNEPDFSNAKDLQRDPIVMWQDKHYVALTTFMNLGLPVLLGVWHGDIIGTVLLVGLLRLVVNHHVTFFINSLAHYWGSRPYTESNSARDNGFLAFLTYGEGYHNYHHIFQADYRNGIRWWQWDPTKWMIALCSRIGLASEAWSGNTSCSPSPSTSGLPCRRSATGARRRNWAVPWKKRGRSSAALWRRRNSACSRSGRTPPCAPSSGNWSTA